jgi:hypothetical protein
MSYLTVSFALLLSTMSVLIDVCFLLSPLAIQRLLRFEAHLAQRHALLVQATCWLFSEPHTEVAAWPVMLLVDS